MRPRYKDIESDDWFEVDHRDFRLKCCDCSLVHDLRFRVNGKGKVEIKVLRNDRATGAARRSRKKAVVIVDD